MFSPSVLPLTVSARGVEQVAELAQQRAQAAGVDRSPPSGTCPTGRMLASTGVVARQRVEAVEVERRRRRGAPSRSGGRSRWSSRRAPARVVTRVVERAARRGCRDGCRSSHTISTMRRPVRAAIRAWRESAAGIDAAPGSVRPSASAALVIVEAVPIVMQWPGRARDAVLDLAPVVLGDVAGAQLGPVLPGVGAAAERLALAVAAQHRPGRQEDRRQVHRRARPSAAPAWSCRSRPSAPRRRPDSERSSSSVSIASRLR